MTTFCDRDCMKGYLTRGLEAQGRIQGRVFGIKPPPLFGKIFQFARGFQEKKSKNTLRKFLDTPLWRLNNAGF